MCLLKATLSRFEWNCQWEMKFSFSETKLGIDLLVQKLDLKVKLSAEEPALSTVFFFFWFLCQILFKSPWLLLC